MKVLQINATYGYSSTGLIVQDIGEMLTKNGSQPFYAYQSYKNQPKDGYVVGNKIDWKAHALLCRVFGKQAYFSTCATKKLIKHIAKIKPDVVHLHNLHSNYINLNLLLKYLGKNDIATVITLHDCWYFTGKCFHYADIGCERFMTGCGNCPKKKAPPRSFIFDASKKVIKDKEKFLSKIPRLAIVGCSDWVAGEAKKGILKNAFITRIYNGVDIDVFKPYEENILEEKYGKAFYMLGMANKWLLPANKNLLEEVLKKLNAELKLVLIGCSDEQIKSLKEKSEFVIPIGFIKDRVELSRYYSSANVFINVTKVDTLPTVNMESICSGTPVITYNSSGSPELVLEGCGKIVDEKTLIELIDGLKKTVSKIKEEDLEVARKTFDKNNCYEKYLQIYLKTLEKRN